jgi:ribosomal protein S18 acetylase RimI-like enzyme
VPLLHWTNRKDK